MKKAIYALIVPLVVAGGLVFANRQTNNQISVKPTVKPLTAAEMAEGRKQWEATPDGVRFKKWEASPEGEKVYAGIANIRKPVTEFANMEAVITSLSLPPGSRLGFGVMVRINGDDYILRFDTEKSQLAQMNSLKVNDKLIIRSHYISYAPKYAYPIVAAEYAERDSIVVFKHSPRKGGC